MDMNSPMCYCLCYTTEYGSSSQFNARIAPFHSSLVQVLMHVAERLKDLHACGYVHRDIKPAKIMWLPRHNRWTIIDFD